MMNRVLANVAAFALALGVTSAPASARNDEDEMKALLPLMSYAVVPNITYRTVDGWTGKLDVLTPRGVNKPNPTLIYYHGGGWAIGSKEERMPLVLPYMAMGWTIVNVEYRLSDVALAPAAAQDARCALWWVFKNAHQTLNTSSGPVSLNIDLNRLVTSGTSAGGHLALLAAVAPHSAGLDEGCENVSLGAATGKGNAGEPRVAAVIDWFGISDVYDLFKDPKTRRLGSSWVGERPGWEQIARKVSPIAYVRPGLPAIISIHGDADPGVPFEQKKRFHEALERVGAPHQLIPIKGGGHGIFSQEDTLRAYAAIRSFLMKYNIIAPDGAK